MIERTITWTNFADEEVTRKYSFHLSKAEAVEAALGFGTLDDDIEAVLNKIIETRDPKVIIGSFKKILLSSVGLRSEDGRQFIKNEEATNEFQHSGAMDELLVDMYSDPPFAASLIQGIFPAKVIEEGIKSGKLQMLQDGGIRNIENVNIHSWGPHTHSMGTIESVTPVNAGVDGLDDLKPDPKVINLDDLSDDDLRAMLSDDSEGQVPTDSIQDNRPTWQKEGRKPTKAETRKMPRSELMLAYRMGLGPMSPTK